MALGCSLVLAAGLAGCATAGERLAEDAQTTAPTSAAPTASTAELAVVPATGAVDVAPDQPVTVTARGGQLATVTLAGPDGSTVDGALDPSRLTWTSTGSLALAASYTLTATALDPNGLEAEMVSTFTTLTATSTFGIRNSPLTGETVGVGMPVVLYLTAPIAAEQRAAVEERLTVTTTPAVEGAWSWIDEDEIHWRPRELWPAGTEVMVEMDTAGVRGGDDLWGETTRTEESCTAVADENCPLTFSITDRAVTSVVNLAEKNLKVYQDEVLLHTFPITAGKPGWETRNGTKVILEKHRDITMDGASVGISPGDPEYYLLDVEYALRVTWSGEFVHAAPWSEGSQGIDNVSHGCVGLSVADAATYFDLTTKGDILTVTNSPRTLEDGNGYTDWNVEWDDWVAGGAVAAAAAAAGATTTGPTTAPATTAPATTTPLP